ncbi:MAG: hypothetical protein KatS3mg104_0769 [Phycisphaerae bacterium]|nr:MAG: hypothetical protein KatS3mg104_0769 [Phycisphaerae bacterium]
MSPLPREVEDKGMVMSDETRESAVRELNANWTAALNQIFSGNVPETARWDGPEAIANVLNKLGQRANSNHMFIPTGGGLDVRGAAPSPEPGCVELDVGAVAVVKPNELAFHAISGPEWSYFRLECDELDAVDGDGKYGSEELTELQPGRYVDRSAWDAGFHGYDDNGFELKLPRSARLVVRYLRGAFVLFSKGSVYNQVSETYDGRHAKMSAEEFRRYIQRSANCDITEPNRPRHK